jgi:hypothetical protein
MALDLIILGITTLGMMPLGIMTLGIKTIVLMPVSKAIHKWHKNNCHNNPWQNGN